MTLTVRPFGAAMRMCLLLLGLLALTQTVNADCATPAGAAGDMTYNTTYNVMAFCNGTNWISMAGATSVGVSDPRIGTISAGGWCQGNGAGTGLDCTAATPGVSPSGVTGDVQFNNGGSLGADSGDFTYLSNVLSAPMISTTALTVTGNATMGTASTGGLTVTGNASITAISASTISGTLIQVGNNGASCTSEFAGSMRYNSTSATLEFCNAVSWTSVGASSGASLTAFTVKNGNQTIANNGIVSWSNASLNNGGAFNTGTGKFMAPASGFYFFIATLMSNADGSPDDFRLYKNGSYAGPRSYNNTAAATSVNIYAPATLQGVLYLVAGDVIDIRNVSGASETLEGTVSSFSGFLLNGGSSGGGGTANPAGSTNDVQFNSGGLLAADTGKFTYASGILSSPAVSTTAISTTVANFASATTYANVLGGLGNMISSGSAVVSTSSAGSITFFTGGWRRMTMDSSGRLGLGGTTLPDSDARLTVEDAVTDYARIRVRNTSNTATSGAGYYFGNTSSGGYASFVVQNSAANTSFGGANSLNMYSNWGNLTFGVNVSGTSTERVRIDTNGNMQIGGTATYGGANARLTVYYVGGGTQHGLTLKPTTDSTNPIDFLNASGSYVGSITQNTTNTTYNTTSDRRVKEHITDTREGLQKLMLLPVRDFAFKSDPRHTVVTGFIAQELEKIFPEAVTTNGDNGETKLTSGTAPWSVDYGRVTPLIVKSVQDLKTLRDADIASLTTQLKAANDNIRELRMEIDQLKKAVGP